MLKYTVKPNKDTQLVDFPVKELYVSPDLLYISGVTDMNISLIDGEEILIKSPYLIGSEINTINVQVVKRQGNAEVSLEIPIKKITSPLKFPIYSDETGSSYILAYNKKIQVDYEGDYVISSVTQNYIEYRGDICYFFDGGDEMPSGYLVDHKFYESSINDTVLKIVTNLYIEDGKLVIGDYTYYADFRKDNEIPELRLSKLHNPIKNGDFIGLYDGYKCYLNSISNYEPKKWERVKKIVIQKHNNPSFEVEDILYGGYKHYVTFENLNYYLRDIYQYNEEEDNDVYRGYGVIINDMFYEASPNYSTSIYENYRDLPYNGSYLYMPETDEYIEIHDSLISPTNGGRFVIIMSSNSESDLINGNFIVAESNYPIDIIRPVETDDDAALIDDNGNGNEYVEFEGKKYLVKEKLYDTINISGEDYLLTYLNESYTSASTKINGDNLYFDITGTTAKLSNKVYYKDPKSVDVIKIKYGINENIYSITESSGVTINGKRYRVIDESENPIDDESIPLKYIIISENIKITLEITDKNGSSAYLAYPVIDDETIDEGIENELQREYCNILVNNWKSFNFYVRKDTFGKNPLTVENGLMNSMSSTMPYSISDAYLLENNISLFKIENYLSFNLPLSNNIANNLRREEIIKNDFVDFTKNELLNKAVDMEKDIYVPVWKDGESFKPIQQIRFNLHFRTRNLDNWKIYEDDREFKNINTPNSLMSNWFVTDLNYYKNDCGGSFKRLHNSSDLLGLMNFTTDEIKNQATKIGKSFLRLSFYSTNNPSTQVLLATSTIFLDESLSYKKYINSKRNADLVFVDTKIMQDAGYKSFSDYEKDVNNKKDVYQVSSSTISDSSEVYSDPFFNEDTRLSSRIVVNDKYNTDTSSEGFYIYLFKEYAKKMHETTIYMKVDFNHAGIGQTIAFMLPRKNGVGDVDGLSDPLYMHLPNDLAKLKNGFKLSDIYKQTYIPINLVYDDDANKYVYYLPEILRENEVLGVDNEIMEFNLFEVKFANESIVENIS